MSKDIEDKGGTLIEAIFDTLTKKVEDGELEAITVSMKFLESQGINCAGLKNKSAAKLKKAVLLPVPSMAAKESKGN
tara:strand:+ start:224 stop:454 length:231 start_codon:yes stop_codon:yes gene_type:complete